MLEMDPPGRRKRAKSKTMFMEAAKEDMGVSDVTEDTRDRSKGRRVTRCGDL